MSILIEDGITIEYGSFDIINVWIAEISYKELK